MAYTPEELKEKLHELYPEIQEFGLSMNIIFDEQKDAWVVSFEKEGHRRHAFLDRKDADACIAGTSCIYLGVLIAQYIKIWKEEGYYGSEKDPVADRFIRECTEGHAFGNLTEHEI